MAQPFILKIGSVDLSNYVRLSPGEGFDPVGAAGFLNPSFIDAPIGEGQLLTNIDIGTRELAWPLHLNAVDKDTVHALIRSINNEVANNQQLRVEWRDQGATFSTYYDVAFARLDPEYDYRKAALNYESGTLRVWSSPPLGHTATSRVATVTTMNATLPVMLQPIASVIGDAPAVLKIRMQDGGNAASNMILRQSMAFAVAPHPSYVCWIPAASFAIPSHILVGATWAYGSQVLSGVMNNGTSFGGRVGRVALGLPTGAYSGRSRIFGIVSVTAPSSKLTDNKPYATSPVYFSAVDDRGTLLGPTAVAVGLNAATGATSMGTAPALQVIDLGIFTMPTYGPIAASGFVQISAGGSLGAPASYALNGLVIMPDETMTYVDLALSGASPMISRQSDMTFDGDGPDDALYGVMSYQTLGVGAGAANVVADAYRRGAVPKLRPSPTAALIFFNHKQPLCSATPGVVAEIHAPADSISITISVRERFQFAR